MTTVDSGVVCWWWRCSETNKGQLDVLSRPMGKFAKSSTGSAHQDALAMHSMRPLGSHPQQEPEPSLGYAQVLREAQFRACEAAFSLYPLHYRQTDRHTHTHPHTHTQTHSRNPKPKILHTIEAQEEPGTCPPGGLAPRREDAISVDLGSGGCQLPFQTPTGYTRER